MLSGRRFCLAAREVGVRVCGPQMPNSSKTQNKIPAALNGAVFDQGTAVDRQVAMHVRELIRAGVLAGGDRLPPIRTLATRWGTNYFSVQTGLRQLVKEGLLVQSPRLGTFVAKQARTLQRVCLYHDEDLKFKGGSEFGGRLHMAIYRRLAARGVLTISHFDHRPREERGVIPAEVRRLVKDRQVDALISTTHHETWMDRLDVPMASLEKAGSGGGVSWDVDGFARLAMDVVRRAGVRRVCVIDRPSVARATVTGEARAEMKIKLEAAIREEGLTVVASPLRDPEAAHKGMEETGFLIGEKIAKMASLPEALVIFPDIYTRGVVSALLKHGVRVPEDLLLISHRNREMEFFTPLPVVWLTVSIEDHAEALLRQIEQQIAGEAAAGIAVQVALEAASAGGFSRARGRR